MELGNIKGFVNVPWNRLDLSPQLLFNSVKSKSVIVGNQVDGHSKMSESSATTNSVQVGLCHLGEVEVDDDVDCLDVDTPCEEVGTDQVSAEAGSEVVEDSVTVSLGHLGVDVVAGVTQLSDLFGQQLHSLCRVAEDDALIDLQL